MTTAQTATPLIVGKDDLTICTRWGYGIATVQQHFTPEDQEKTVSDEAKANAERIVLTWNAHDDLVKALQSAMPFMKGHQETPELRERYQFQLAALAKAGVSK